MPKEETIKMRVMQISPGGNPVLRVKTTNIQPFIIAFSENEIPKFYCIGTLEEDVENVLSRMVTTEVVMGILIPILEKERLVGR